VVLVLFAAVFVVPVIWLVLAPTKTAAQLDHEAPLALGSLAAFARTFQAMVHWQGGDLLKWLKNSAVYCGGGTSIAVITSVPAGYGLALTQFVGRRTLLWLTLVVTIIPANALVLPLFLEMNAVHAVGTMWSLILPFGLFPVGVYLTYLFFTSAIPADLLAAARIDAASEWQVFRHVALPLAAPIVAFVTFFSFVADWNNYYLPFVMTYDIGQFPVQVGLQQLVVGLPGPDLAMATIIAVAPLALLFMLAQRWLVAGMLTGATSY
jgi:multiple sugar transport system permease protein